MFGRKMAMGKSGHTERKTDMAVLTPNVMFRKDNTTGYTSEEIAGLNFELMDVLGVLEPGSDKYTERAKAFHDEVSRRPRDGRIVLSDG
jgi:hypothetical protein